MYYLSLDGGTKGAQEDGEEVPSNFQPEAGEQSMLEL